MDADPRYQWDQLPEHEDPPTLPGASRPQAYDRPGGVLLASVNLDQPVKGSWFGNSQGWGDAMDSGLQANGTPVEGNPGIALGIPRDDPDFGKLYKVTTPDGREFHFPQTDVGPAARVGRGVDINSAAAKLMGYTPNTFPTDSHFIVSEPDPQSTRAVPEPSPRVPAKGSPGSVGPFNSSWDAYEGAPQDRQNYRLLQDGNHWTWQMKPPGGDPPGQINPYYSATTTDKSVNAAVINGPHSWQDPINRIVGVTGQSFNNALASTLDLPAFVVDKALDAISAGTGTKRLDFHFGTPARNAMNKLGFETESKEPTDDDPLSWATTLGRGIGTGLGMALPFEVGGAAAASGLIARGTPRVAEAMQGMSGIGTGGTGFGAETSMAAGSGVGQQEAHEFYKSQTGREGDLGDVASQLGGGSVWNLGRISALMALEKAGVAAFSKAWSGAKEGLYGNPGAAETLDPVTGQAVADATLRHQFSDKLATAEDHVAGLSGAPPGDSAMYLADRASAAKRAVNAFAEGSARDEQALLGTVNTEMPRDLTNTKLMYQRMRADYADQGPHVINDWPKELDRIFARDEPGSATVTARMQGQQEAPFSSSVPGLTPPSSTGALKDIDTLGRAHTVRMDVNRLIESELGSGNINEVRLGVLQKVRNSLAEDLTKGEEGISPEEIDAYRMLNAFSKARSGLMESPELQAFLGNRVSDPTALERLLKQGPEGASAVQILTGAAQARYGADGLLGAAQDTLRQKYANTVAPYGYVSLGAHNAFMQRFGAVLDHPTMTNLRDQFNAAAQAESNVNSVVGFGKPGGFRNAGGIMERRADLAETYLNSPLNVVFAHLENTTTGDIATRRVFQDLHVDPTGEAAKGFQHAVAGRILANPDYIKQNPGIMSAVERENPGFTQAAVRATDPSYKAGLLKTLGDWALSYLGARVAGNMSQGLNMGGGMVMAQRGAGFVRQLGEKARKQLTEVSSATIVDPEARSALDRLMSGGSRPFQRAADMMLLHSYVPGLAVGNLPSNPTPNTGQPGSPVAPGGEWWTKIGQPSQ